MIRKFYLIFFTLLPLIANGSVKIGDINYDLDEINKTAVVRGVGDDYIYVLYEIDDLHYSK